MRNLLHSRIFLILCLLLFLLALPYRLRGLSTPLWVDEFSTARQAALWRLHGFRAPDVAPYIEHHNFLTHWLVALTTTIGGENAQMVRLPSVIAGSLVPVAVFILGSRVHSKRVGLAASLLTLFSYIEITWSRQGRGYMLQQLFSIVAVYFAYQLLSNPARAIRPKDWIGGIVLVIAGIINHVLFVCSAASMATAVIVRYRTKLLLLHKRPEFYVVLVVGVLIFVATGFLRAILHAVSIGLLEPTNNLWYYHSFLWREYGAIVVLGALGMVVAIRTNPRFLAAILPSIFFHLTFVTFFFQSTDSRYLLPFFPWSFFLSSAIFFDWFLRSLFAPKLLQRYGAVVLALILVINGNQFTIKPKQFYSVNHDMREIALVDYDQVYARVLLDPGVQSGTTALIETWPDRVFWYLGHAYTHGFVFRWENNGPMQSTTLDHDPASEWRRERSSQFRFVGNLEDLRRVEQSYQKGFIWIDDTSLPADVLDYVRTSYRKEITVDRFALDDNPYSVWPGTLYSWGQTTKKENTP